MQLFAALGAARRHLCIQRFSCLEGIGSTRISRMTAAHSTGTCSSLSLSWKYVTSKKVPGGGRGPGLRTPCASSLLLKSLVVGMTLDQATRALDGSCRCSGAGHASCSSAVERMWSCSPHCAILELGPRMRALHVFFLFFLIFYCYCTTTTVGNTTDGRKSSGGVQARNSVGRGLRCRLAVRLVATFDVGYVYCIPAHKHH
ncbi:hypothetical protein ACQJBY_022534 [Aegilops geniculata]